MFNKYYEFRKVKTTYILEWREYNITKSVIYPDPFS